MTTDMDPTAADKDPTTTDSNPKCRSTKNVFMLATIYMLLEHWEVTVVIEMVVGE